MQHEGEKVIDFFLKLISWILFFVASVFFTWIVSELKTAEDLSALFSMKYADFSFIEFEKDSLYFFTHTISAYILSIVFAINTSWVKWQKNYIRAGVTLLLLGIFMAIGAIPYIGVKSLV